MDIYMKLNAGQEVGSDFEYLISNILIQFNHRKNRSDIPSFSTVDMRNYTQFKVFLAVLFR